MGFKSSKHFLVFSFVVFLFGVLQQSQASSAATLKERIYSLPRIVGGESAEPGQFPFQASVRYDGSHFCGGSMLSSTKVLCAAHCCDAVNSKPLQYLSILTGSNNIDSTVNDTRQILSVTNMTVHKSYKATSTINDVCVLDVNPAAKTGDGTNVAFIKLDNGTTDWTGRLATVTGWGTESEGGSITKDLRVVNVTIRSDADCTRAYGKQYKPLMMICAGEEAGGKDSCQGDSGGPLFISENGNNYQVGIVSWGIGCARPGLYGVYTRVSAYKTWIESKM